MAARLTTFVVVAIVAATLIAGLIVGAQRDDSDGPVDLIVHNAKVYTATGGGAMAEAVAIRGNQILRVGGEREITRLRRPQTVMIDAKGGTVVPGFNDSHLELISGGSALDQIDLLGAETVAEIEQRIRDWAEANPDRPWVLGRGWHRQVFADKTPSRQLLDRVVSDRPVELVSADGRSAWVNTEALRLAGISRTTPNPPRGAIEREPATGEPSGLLEDEAVSLVSRLAPAIRPEERERALRAAIAEAHRFGITSIQDPSGTPDEFAAYAEARRAGDLKVRVYAALPIEGDPSDAALDRIGDVIAKYPDDPLFKAGAVSLTLDGSVETESAAMLEPYAVGPRAGTTTLEPDDLNRIVRRLDARGWQIQVRATGDRAVQMALNAYEHARRSNPARTAERRHRIDGAQLIAADDVPRFAGLGVTAVMLPVTGSPSEDNIVLWSRLLGPERAALGWPSRALARAKGQLAFGSGWPAAPLNPMLGLHVAVNRTAAAGPVRTEAEPWSPDERLSLKSAIDAYTTAPAWLSFDEQRKGPLEAGMLADLVVLSSDIFKAPASSIAATPVALTIFDGKVVYRRAAAGTN